ncbi:serine/threonine-protein phosphatase [Actinospica durhamensis]|uniref:Serine/threonine-protein phosphatase n=1 Tax=Actinospica durhamensis TaxID=1508375 RepID=A0A941IR00_9ACTN|nr:PP2C family protein-serine/threonine phosphatase [Actinospica durhamensis]MBR7834762.1 serine/threonine-protein phosphatase [Actinospica durhamensis]
MPSLPTVHPRLAAHWSASRLGRFSDRLLDGDPAAGQPVLLGLLAVVGLLTWGSIEVPNWDPPSSLVFPVLIGGVLLGQVLQLLLYASVLAALVVDGFLREPFGVTPGTAVVLILLAATVLFTSRVRLRLGLRGHRAETLLLELSDRLQPAVTPGSELAGWSAAHALVPAGGARFSGDFLISCAPEYPGLHVALVDVSGKGSRAAGRALQLSGALRALLDAMPPDGFLEAANDHVFLRGWDEGFATAVHASLDPDTGRFEVYNAGHHPAARWRDRDQRWERLEEGGPALGLLAGERYAACEGVLEPGDALLLFTDGLVERPDESLEAGTGRLLEAAGSLLRDEWVLAPDAAARLVRTVAPHGGDDRAVLLLRRDPPHPLAQPPAARRDREVLGLADAAVR